MNIYFWTLNLDHIAAVMHADSAADVARWAAFHQQWTPAGLNTGGVDIIVWVWQRPDRRDRLCYRVTAPPIAYDVRLIDAPDLMTEVTGD